MIKNLIEVKKIGYESCRLLENNDLNQFGELMNYQWIKKMKDHQKGPTKDKTLYDYALKMEQ